MTIHMCVPGMLITGCVDNKEYRVLKQAWNKAWNNNSLTEQGRYFHLYFDCNPVLDLRQGPIKLSEMSWYVRC